MVQESTNNALIMFAVFFPYRPQFWAYIGPIDPVFDRQNLCCFFLGERWRQPGILQQTWKGCTCGCSLDGIQLNLSQSIHVLFIALFVNASRRDNFVVFIFLFYFRRLTNTCINYNFRRRKLRTHSI